MASLNEVRLIGRLTRNIENRTTNTGMVVGRFSVAVDTRKKNQDGSWGKETDFIDCTVFGKTADNMSQYTSKGSLVFVAGRLKLDQWTEKETGKNRSKLNVIANNVQFLDSRNKQPDQQKQYAPQQQYAQPQQPRYTPSFNYPQGNDEPPF